MRILLTGATGFVGRHLYPALVATGCEVRCATRDPDTARAADPGRDWVELDVDRPETMAAALAGCDAAYYLIHGMSQGDDYPEREARGARDFSRAAEVAGIRRVVYLGGVIPNGPRVSKHLRSRERTGAILREGVVSTVELRAAMIMGVGSASWTMVKDLSARLPAMILPRWLRNHSYPVAVDDVIRALLSALVIPGTDSTVFDVPGPERISHRDVLRRVAAVMGRQRVMVNVPVLTPHLSSYWIALVTRVDLDLARELVEGVRYDLDPRQAILWDQTQHVPMGLEAAARLALDDEAWPSIPSPAAMARAQEIGRTFAGTMT